MFLIFLLRNYWIGEIWLEEHQIEEYWLDNHCIDIHWLDEYYLDKHCLDDHFLNVRRTIDLQSVTYKRCWLYYYYTCITIPTENTNWIKWRRNYLQFVLLFLIYFYFFFRIDDAILLRKKCIISSSNIPIGLSGVSFSDNLPSPDIIGRKYDHLMKYFSTEAWQLIENKSKK